MSNLATLQPDPVPVVACTISRDVQNFEQLIEDMEEELGESWGDLSIDDAPAFLSQSDADSLKYVVMALDGKDEPELAPILSLIRLTVDRRIKLIMVTADLNANMLNQLLRAGAEHFVHYPLARGALSEVIAHLDTLPKPAPVAKSAPPKAKTDTQPASSARAAQRAPSAPAQDPLLLGAALQVKAAPRHPQPSAALRPEPAAAAIAAGVTTQAPRPATPAPQAGATAAPAQPAAQVTAPPAPETMAAPMAPSRKRNADQDMIRMRHALREAAAELAQPAAPAQPAPQTSAALPPVTPDRQAPHVAGTGAPSSRFVEPGVLDPVSRADEHYAPRPPSHQAGFVIPVHGLSGGSGSSTLAVNLAWELAHLRPGAAAPRVCLMDFDFQYGSVATYLDQPRGDDVYDVLTQTLRNPPQRFFDALTRVTDSLHVMTAPVDMLPLDIIGAEEATKLIDYAASQYDYVIIDLPKAIVAWTEAVITRADLYFVMMELDLRSAQNVLRLMRALKAEALPYQKLRYLLNRSPKMTDLGSKSRIRRLAESLDITIDVELPDGGVAVTQANDQGQPLAEAAAENPLRSEILRLATSLDSNHHPRRFRNATL